MKPAGRWSVGKSYGAVVSSSPDDSAYPGGADADTVAAYGGHLVAESICSEHRVTIAALPELIAVVEGFLNIKSEMLEGPQKDLLVAAAEGVLAKAGVRR